MTPEVISAENFAALRSSSVIKSATPTSSFHLSSPVLETLWGFNGFVLTTLYFSISLETIMVRIQD